MKSTAILLAAGRARRMGRPKILLRVGGEPLLARSLAALGEICARTIAVLPEELPAAWKIAQGAGAQRVAGASDGEMMDSLRCGLAVIPRGTPVCVALGDQPLRPKLPWLRTLAALAASHPELPVLPLYRGQRGHPVFLPATLCDSLRETPPAGGLRELLRAAPELIFLETGDPLAVLDLDTPEDWQRFRHDSRRARR